jgi:SpoVK/Ycf46/Vps4 family AAA+-type ATPase
MTASVDTQTSIQSWVAASQAHLDAELQRLRLLLQRRVLWLRCQWQQDPLQNCQGWVISETQADWLLAGEDREAEALFYQQNPEAAAIGQSIAEVERQIVVQVKDLMEAGTPPPLEVLAHLFDLTPFERDVLLLCLAPELDASFERLYAYVQDDVNRKFATPHLALALFADLAPAEVDKWNSFLPQAPLCRYRLVAIDTTPGSQPRAMRPLHLDERIADYLRGVNRPDERVASLLHPLTPAPLSPPHQELVEHLTHTIDAAAGQGTWHALNLTGEPGSGKRAVARALCSRLGMNPVRLDIERLPAPGPERHEVLRLLEREAVLLQLAFYLDADKLDPNDRATPASIDDLIERLGAFLILGSREHWQAEQVTLAVQVPKPDTAAQHAMWQQVLDGVPHSLNGHVEALVQQFDLGPQAIAQAVTSARAHVCLRPPADAPDGASPDGIELTLDDLWQACREQAGWQLDELAQRIIPCYTWEDIVLPKDVFHQLQEIAAQVAHRPQVYGVWGFGEKLSRGRGISALFSGPSGTGKTMAAEILASHLKLDLYRIDLAGVVSKYIGETEKNLKKVFDAAERSGAVLFFDEADALFGKRTEVKDSHDRYANIEVNYLLQRMEDYRGLAILATNRKSTLDEAFMRRLRFLVDFPFPDSASRQSIWQKVFPPQAEVEGLDHDRLARLEIPGGNIRNIALNAAFLAADEGKPIGMDHVMRAARREYAKIDKLVTAAEFGPYYELIKL